MYFFKNDNVCIVLGRLRIFEFPNNNSKILFSRVILSRVQKVSDSKRSPKSFSLYRYLPLNAKKKFQEKSFDLGYLRIKQAG